MRTKPAHIALAVLVGIGLGIFSHESSSLPGGLRWLGNFGALWVAIAFLVGRLISDVNRGAIAGAATLCVAAVVHYVPYRLAREGVGSDALRWPVVLWLLVGIGVGVLFGALGAAYGRREATVGLVGVALLAATFAGEAFVLARTGHPRAVQIAVPLELAVAALLPIIFFRSWRERSKVFGITLLAVPLVVLALSAFMGVIHRVYPGI